jgi:hypothetical protein
VLDLTTGLPLPPVVCAILLGDVGDIDELRLPLKTTTKFKKGGLGRDEEEIESIAPTAAIDDCFAIA